MLRRHDGRVQALAYAPHMAKTKSKSGTKAAGAGAAAGFAARGYTLARNVNWAAVWVRAQWLAHHTKRLYDNLDEKERKEFMNLVVPMKDGKSARAAFVSKSDRARLQQLVTKALFGDQNK